MSYTMTLDVPDRTAAYVERRGPRYRAELNAIFVAIVAANMKSDEAEARREDSDEKEFKAARLAEKSKLDFVADWGRFQVREDELNLSRTNSEHVGKTPSVIDAQIAATALANGMTMVTRNVKDFNFEGLSVINPFDKEVAG